jgi:RNA polymerase sigma factor for flagellar operon FliA
MTPAEVAYKMSAGDIEDRNALVMQELSQVYYIATRIRERLPQQVELEDLVNAGVIGLMEASQSFNSSKNIQFKSFAKFRIRGAIMDSLRESDWGSRSLRRKGREISEAVARLEAKLGRHPVESEIAEEMQLDLAYLQSIIGQVDGLFLAGQQAAVSNDQTDLLDVIESAPNLTDPDPFDLCLEGETKAHLEEALSKLSEREQLILSLYYREELTMKEISEVVGVALSRVSQIRQAAMKKLRESLAHLHERPSQPSPAFSGQVERAQSNKRRDAGPALTPISYNRHDSGKQAIK